MRGHPAGEVRRPGGEVEGGATEQEEGMHSDGGRSGDAGEVGTEETNVCGRRVARSQEHRHERDSPQARW